jgi:Sulfatase
VTSASGVSRASRVGFGSSWLLLLGLCSGILTLVDALLIGRSTDLFTGGFLVVQPQRTALHFMGFLLASLVLDVTLVLGIWLIGLPLLRRLRLGTRQRVATAAMLALLPPLAFLYVRYQLSRYLGELIDPGLWLALAGGSPIEWFAQAEAQLIPVAATLTATLVAGGLLVRALRSAPDPASVALAFAVPTAGALLLGFAAAAVGSIGIFSLVCSSGGGADCEALETKASGAVLVRGLERLTDFDLDGYGLFSPLTDQAPFDPSRHPFALDIPGDGIDQNGLAGDHPADYQPPADEFTETPVFKRRPNVLIIFLEGVRADILGARVGGRAVTPFLDELVAQGARSEHAYANSPYTARSRGQLMGGRLAPYPGQSTLIDDFHANGYTVAWFSGQDESFGLRESEMLGLARTDAHFDARDDPAHTVSRFRTSGSLAVSWKQVNRRIGEYLDTRSPGRPLLLYVNYGDTHFPYDHRELDNLLGVERLKRREIQPENGPGVYRTYANATANVDLAIRELVSLAREKLGGGDLSIIVTSDHGEALFEDGVLGHGLALDSTQTRVPLVVVGLGGVWPEPLGLSDVRASLQRALEAGDAGSHARARFEPVPGRRILQYMALVENPRLLCLRGLDTELRYDTSRRAPPESADFDSLIWWWESLQLANARHPAGG